ncbi:hypothetical protein SARC_07197 [Sphaeroforma arctica JP610]|uniref:Uncharacterized protein n=1 Tax=Sphaeroforma arctica JP610 TaxID=667725 RepID=A0A0L0FV58_9EUKA|nr:hypothetical protein SARC_07197 [Sphaeroforma arctica JP610]KNC80446.1 hypothetical protein SARC_07197 [Sphaeroforma arctica JP610]|eukprot:XP_014154348.1 hypothetical protein SARC_07197 [Sphaeroforma arctica JP610]
MTCLGGGVELYDRRAGALGEDPLRDDADPEALFKKIQKCTATQVYGQTRLPVTCREHILPKYGVPVSRCGSHVLSWDVGARTCYGCVTCQPIGKVTAVTATDSTQAALKFDNPVAIATPTRPVPRSSHATKQNKQTATNTTTTVARSTTTDIEVSQ